MKKSMLNVIILALVLVNLVLTVILTFSLVSTNKKTNSLINKVAQIIDLDVACAGPHLRFGRHGALSLHCFPLDTLNLPEGM